MTERQYFANGLQVDAQLPVNEYTVWGVVVSESVEPAAVVATRSNLTLLGVS